MNYKEYECVSLCKTDLKEQFKGLEDKINDLTDEQMEWLAKKVGDSCIEQQFWFALEYFGGELLA